MGRRDRYTKLSYPRAERCGNKGSSCSLAFTNAVWTLSRNGSILCPGDGLWAKTSLI